MKRDFLRAYRAGRQAAETKRDVIVIVAIAVVISDFVERWLTVRYSLPWFEKYPLSFLSVLLVIVSLTTLREKLRI